MFLVTGTTTAVMVYFILKQELSNQQRQCPAQESRVCVGGEVFAALAMLLFCNKFGHGLNRQNSCIQFIWKKKYLAACASVLFKIARTHLVNMIYHPWELTACKKSMFCILFVLSKLLFSFERSPCLTGLSYVEFTHSKSSISNISVCFFSSFFLCFVFSLCLYFVSHSFG